MRPLFLYLSLALLWSTVSYAQIWSISQMAPMPERISNNAVVEGWLGNNAYIYSFAGIDSTKLYSGIHLRAYRYHVQNDTWEAIDPLPDTLGKIAASASRIKDTIYIIGGYHVFANGNEISSNKVHRYDINNNQYLSDGMPIPIAIDDQVQAVWRDSLIYVITGWSNTTNVPNVQIYNPSTNSWSIGSSTPNNTTYKAFGASGTIIGDTIYYLGGASTSFNFPAQRILRKGIIDPNNPNQITWSDSLLDNSYLGYRMAAAASQGLAFWLGGSTVSYNYNGIAYNGSGGVAPSGRSIFYDPISNFFQQESGLSLPMDLRGIGQLSDTIFYLVGGMNAGQSVSNQTLRLSLNPTLLETTNRQSKLNSEQLARVFPNPCTLNEFNIELFQVNENASYRIIRYTGQHMQEGKLLHEKNQIFINKLPPGLYWIEIRNGRFIEQLPLMIQN